MQDLNLEAVRIGFKSNHESFRFNELQGNRLSTRSHVSTIKNIKKYKYDLTISSLYRLNSKGLRGDELTQNHDGYHVVFAGCSTTFGDGMLEEFTWPKMVYEKISEHREMSGFFNLGVCGASSLQILSQVFKYISEFGNPDVIFILLPDFERELGYQDGQSVEYGDTSSTVFGIYQSLSLYCLSNDINLFTFTWDKDFNGSRFAAEANNFYVIDPEQETRYLYEYENNNSDSPYRKIFYQALDGEHPGIAHHSYYSDFIYDKWRSECLDI